MSEKPSLTLVRRIKASPAKIYAAWTEPARMVRWWGPDAGPVLSAEADPRPGGRFRVVFQTMDGEKHDCRGVYREVEPNRKLVFTWQWVSTPDRESLVTVELRPVPEGTELTLTHAQFHDEAVRDRHRVGWSGSLGKLTTLFDQPVENIGEVS
ncbi:MAG TPA: SRPBCC domain-containing protein [Acetobacteraceae bacterium]|nr:SRPBCC domain-containing protein [Acetobacteraceae bacterium]